MEGQIGTVIIFEKCFDIHNESCKALCIVQWNIQMNSKWISVNERLPDHLQKVLFCFADGEGPSAWYSYPVTMEIGDFYRKSPTEATFRHDCHPVNNNKVAWWMPIPSKPSSN